MPIFGGDVLNEFLSKEHSADGSQKVLPQSKITDLTTDLAAKVTKAGDTMSGNLTVPSLAITGGTLASGKVLTSDNSGNATWQDIPDQTPQLSWGSLIFGTNVADYGGAYSPVSAALDGVGKVHLRGLLSITGPINFNEIIATLPSIGMYPFYKKLVWAFDGYSSEAGYVFSVNTDGTIRSGITSLNSSKIPILDGITFDIQA